MSHRRPEQAPPGLDAVLRSALRLAVDSVEPAAGGLDRIRAKIATGRHAPRLGWGLAAVAYLEPLRRLLGPAGLWLGQAGRAVATRFRPEPGRGDLLGWLRPAAALATGLFVVASASWAIAALPSELASNSGNFHHLHGAGGGSSGGGARSSSYAPGGGTTGYSSGPGGIGSSSPGRSSPSCKSTSPGSAKSPSSSPSGSPSPSPSASSSSTTPSTSPSPSPSPTGSPSTSSSPSSSPTAGPTQSPAASSQATQPGPASPSGQTGPGSTSGAAKSGNPGARPAVGLVRTSPISSPAHPSTPPCR